jgi:predicted DCC family thiol-disulfide oxidoreductase YuxK
MTDNKYIILFDGICNFCNSSVNFILKRDKNNIFKFSPLQSEAGQRFLNQIYKSENFNKSKRLYTDTIILLEGRKFYTRSTAVLRIVKKLKGIWKFLYIFIIIPPSLRNFIYNLLSKNRYKWFGKRDKCMIPTDKDKSKFIIH